MKENRFYSSEIARGKEEQDKFMALIAAVEKNPNDLDTLSMDELERIKAYYDKLIEEKEKELERLQKAAL